MTCRSLVTNECKLNGFFDDPIESKVVSDNLFGVDVPVRMTTSCLHFSILVYALQG